MCRFSKLLKKQTTAFVCFSLWTTSAHLTFFHPMILLVATDEIMQACSCESHSQMISSKTKISFFLPHLKNKNQLSTTKECSSHFIFLGANVAKICTRISGYGDKMVKTCDRCQQLSFLILWDKLCSSWCVHLFHSFFEGHFPSNLPTLVEQTRFL